MVKLVCVCVCMRVFVFVCVCAFMHTCCKSVLIYFCMYYLSIQVEYGSPYHICVCVCARFRACVCAFVHIAVSLLSSISTPFIHTNRIGSPYQLCLFGMPWGCPSVHLAERDGGGGGGWGGAFNVGHCMQTFQPNAFIPAIDITFIDLYHFIPLSDTLTLVGGHKVTGKQYLLAWFSGTLFK